MIKNTSNPAKFLATVRSSIWELVNEEDFEPLNDPEKTIDIMLRILKLSMKPNLTFDDVFHFWSTWNEMTLQQHTRSDLYSVCKQLGFNNQDSQYVNILAGKYGLERG